MRKGKFTNTDVDTIEELFAIDVSDAEFLFVNFVVGVANLSAFEVSFRPHPDAGWSVVGTLATDYTSPAGVIDDASGDLTAAAFGSTVHWLRLNVGGVDAVRLRAAGTSSTVTGYYGMQ